MKNKVQKGQTISVIAPYGVTSGQGVQVGALFGVASCDAANATPVEIERTGVFDITAVPADTGAQGAKIYWDNTARRLTTTATNNTLVGALTAAKGGSDTTARVLLDGVVR
jgi:predicted RecA/RadA family phage recombinase